MDRIEFVEVSDPGLIKIVEKLARSIWRQHYVPIIGKDQVEYMLEKFQSKEAILNQIKKEGYHYYLLRDISNDNWIGYVGIVHKQNELFLSKLYIAVEERSKGYGKRAVEFIETLARHKGLDKISLTVNKNNKDSIGVYKNLGFVITDSLVTDIGNGFVMDDYRMEKSITGPRGRFSASSSENRGK
ncbi:MAG: GNAT family N-acetyltransferase [Candidatus Ratteibacteria bacterium]|nr:GNAT family N-acetyltransferase [Candidatus Ratteibacteria bacterium]